MKLRNGIVVDRALDINPIATRAIAQRNASSPLLRLPLEIKIQIYKYAFGGNLLHISENHKKGAAKFKNTICRALISEEEAQENFDNETSHKWLTPKNENRHDNCRFQEGRARKGRPEMLRLSALRCCRQMYNEAHHVPYSTNTFSCDDRQTLQNFVVSLAQGNNDNHLAIRSLFLEIEYPHYRDDSSWKSAFVTCAKHLKALQNVSVSIHGHTLHGHTLHYADGRTGWDMNVKRWKNHIISPILTLKTLPLKTATVVIGGIPGANKRLYDMMVFGLAYHNQVTKCWTLDEKKECARYVRDVLLQSSC